MTKTVAPLTHEQVQNLLPRRWHKRVTWYRDKSCWLHFSIQARGRRSGLGPQFGLDLGLMTFQLFIGVWREAIDIPTS